MGKKLLIILLIVSGIFSIGIFLFSRGIITLPTMEENDKGNNNKILKSVDELQDGSYYVWNANKKTTSFRLCPSGTYNWKDNEFANHTMWFKSREDTDIPTIYPGDKLIYVSKSSVPYDGINWERFADYGYTIGVANMMSDKSGHYRITRDDENGFSEFINPNSDTNILDEYANLSEIFLDKIENTVIRENNISAGGTVLGLEKNKKYVCEWYTGTFYQDYEMKADNHTFCSLESFTTYDYEFLHGNCIAITLPKELKSGYYYINNMGFFRYITEKDYQVYNGKSYDPNINWNIPIILHDENDFVIYDPFEGIDKRQENNESLKNDKSNAEISNSVSDGNESDGGAEEYENFSEIVP